MNQDRSMVKRIIGITVFVLLILAVVLLAKKYLGFVTPFAAGETSPYIMQLTQPVYGISGKIDRVNDSSIIVSYQVAVPPTMDLSQPGASTKPETVTFEVLVGKDTAITSSPSTVGGLPSTEIVQANANPNSLTIKDLTPGRYVNISSAKDLRKVGGNKFEARSITVAPPVTSFSGVVSEVGQDVVVIKGYAMTPNPAMSGSGEKVYRVAIGADSAITQYNIPTNPTNQPTQSKLQLSDLKAGTSVTVVADKDVTENNEVKAVSIQVVNAPTSLPAVDITQSGQSSPSARRSPSPAP